MKSRRPVCMVASFITLVLIVVLLIRIVVPELIESGKLLAAKVPEAIILGLLCTVGMWILRFPYRLLREDVNRISKKEGVNQIQWKSKSIN